MVGEGSFLVEEFIDSITSQLDRVQDALRIKAVNRPLTYALKDITLELKVFVELDPQGRVRFRTSGPNEAGASVVHLGFTTITKPMIEENTVSLAATRSPSLAEVGLAPEESQRLERLGVRNVAQLERLNASTGVQTVSRFTEVPIDRLRRALAMGRPKVSAVRPEPSRPAVQPPAPRPLPPSAKPATPAMPATPRPAPPAKGWPAVPSRPGRPVLKVPPDTRRLQLTGRRLVGEDGPPNVRLNDRQLMIAEADDDRLVIEMPDDYEGGALEIGLPDGSVVAYELSVEGDGDDGSGLAWDPWAHDGGSEGGEPR